MKKILLAIGVALIINACASSGVVPMDKGTYMISQRSAQIGMGPPVGVKADVYREANEFCNQRGKAVETVNLEMIDSMPARPGSVVLQFRCVSV